MTKNTLHIISCWALWFL